MNAMNHQLQIDDEHDDKDAIMMMIKLFLWLLLNIIRSAANKNDRLNLEASQADE